MPDVNGKRHTVWPTSASSVYNGYSMDNMLKEFGINPKNMRNNMKRILLLFSLLLLATSCNKIDRDKKVDKNKILAGDYRLFQDTPAWELAKAVQDNDIGKIDEEIKKNPEVLNYQEKIYGNTLLHLSIYNNSYKGFKELLTLGANPNIADSMQCSSPLIIACASFDNTTKYAEELIKHKANVNYIECSTGKNEQKMYRTPLITASGRNHLDIVKLLIDNGAKVNYNDGSQAGSALGSAALASNYDIVLYLLQQGTDCSKVLYEKGGAVNPKDIYMKNWIEDEADHSAKEYSEIKELLKKKGCL
ncbi:ankyrin repeat domain-containing protein [Chryseobacterium cheonjiense]|uniref:Ankyrin repeat domain-containing protein n=1 Tax=Chryseobacterium cheonjiense TaxID=2728845 RepID=A0A7Y0A9Y1_9FLAO|nr:ankyrin repeat domain-containing protein [Chryseobacterium cheonjiense]NML59403.1 ankyrin repeat domain-containing protein [Chryseobacterium cheonjiense]